MDFNKILVPLTGSPVDDEAMRLACQLAKKSKSKIWAVYVIAVKRSLPLDAQIRSETARAEAILDHIATVAEEADYEVETDLLQAREVGPTIVDEAVEREVDLIIMGLSYKQRFGQFSLGTAVPYVLTNALCRVILYREHIT